jgi:1A family penicillin-binding protein
MTPLLLKGLLIGIVGFFILGFLMFLFLSRNLPEPGSIKRNTGFSTVVLDRDDKTLYELYEDKNRIPVSIKEIPDYLKEATIATEDKSFYTHQGFSTWGIVRSVFRILTTGHLSSGSTLTQQLVKNVLLTQEQTLTRKVKEVVLSVEIERRFTKDEILEMYLNESPYGGTFWGVQSASKGYFDKNVKDLNLIESAILAGLPQRPSFYNPLSGREGAYKGRTKDVLRRMREDKYITKDEEKKALQDLEKISFKNAPGVAIEAPHFVFYVRRLVAEKFGEKILDQGIKIKTTLSLEAQQEAEKILKEEIGKLKSFNVGNGSTVVLDSKTAEILAMVGSYDYNDEKFGRYNTTTALRQPGSAVKPITYATALEQGYTASSLVMDVPTEFPDQGGKTYNPVNYDGKFRGPVQYRFALANSLNVPAVKVLANVGVRNFLQKAYDMGLTNFEPTPANLKRFGLAITLGGGETTLLDLTSAFSVFARGGNRIEPVAILEIRDVKGKIIYKASEPKQKKVLSPEVSFIISHILSDNTARSEAFGSNSYLRIPGKTVSVKTGTTNDKRDNWTIGYTKDVTVGVWVGNNDNSPMNQKIASGVTGASPIWNRVMKNMLKTYKDGIIEKPEGVDALQIDAFLGGLPKDGYPIRSEYFVKGTEPKTISPFYKKLKFSKSTGKLANDIEIKQGDYDERDFIVISEADPVSTDGKNRWQEAIEAWAYSQNDEKFKPSRDVSDSKQDELVVSIREPGNESRVNSNNVKVVARVTSIQEIRKVEIQVNGTTVKTYNENKKDIEENLNLSDGTYEIKVIAENVKGARKDTSVRIGVNKEWNESQPQPTVTLSPTP